MQQLSNTGKKDMKLIFKQIRSQRSIRFRKEYRLTLIYKEKQKISQKKYVAKPEIKTKLAERSRLRRLKDKQELELLKQNTADLTEIRKITNRMNQRKLRVANNSLADTKEDKRKQYSFGDKYQDFDRETDTRHWTFDLPNNHVNKKRYVTFVQTHL